MEEIAAVVLQVVFELGLQFFGAAGIDAVDVRSKDRTERGCGWIVLHTFFGGLAGWISTLFFPKLVLVHVALRVANLIVAPLLAGGVSYLIAKQIRHQSDTWHPFWHGFAFALAFGLARFAFGDR